jgi:putative hydrolase of the HAD superfamily
MPYNARITTVILDFGGVLGLPQDPVRQAAMAALCGLSSGAFSRLYFRDRLELDRGTLSTRDYWSGIFREAGVEPTTALISRIEEEDSLGWTRINWPVVAWGEELRSAGFSTAILSNMPCDKLAWMRKNPDCAWMGAFPVAVFSCEHRLVKPEPEIYRRCLDLLDRQGAECLFLDDSPVNVEGGRAAGITSMQFCSAAETAAEISRAWGLPVRSLLGGAR